ncbi:unnamed protein product, partial [Oikopleura dioica]
GLGLYKNQPASVGCYYKQHQKAETLSATGWTALPNHPKRISRHSLVALDNQSLLLIGGQDWGYGGASQSGIWQLKNENWNKIGELLQSDVFILVIPSSVDKIYLQSGDGSSQISATINAPENNYAYHATHALVNGKLHIFGGSSDYKKIARLDDCTLNELTVRLNEQRISGHAALSIENGKKALICFGDSGDIRKSCEIFDDLTTVSTFASDSTHTFGGLGLYKNQPASVGCYYKQHQKAETLSATGWTALPNHPKRISRHSLVALDNQSLLLIGGQDWGYGGASQSGIWQLKNENWNKIGELLQANYFGSAIYIGRSIYYFGYISKAIQRLDFTETEEFHNVAQIGSQPGNFAFPVLFQTVSNYCL